MEIDAGVMPPMMENTPHVRTDSAQVEDIIQGFIDQRPGRDGVVIAVMSDVQQEKCLREPPEKVEGNKLPRTGPESIESNPGARQHCQTDSDLDPHRTVGFRRNVRIGKKTVQTATKDSWKRRRTRGFNHRRRGALGWYKLRGLRLWSDHRFGFKRHRRLREHGHRARRAPLRGVRTPDPQRNYCRAVNSLQAYFRASPQGQSRGFGT